MSGMAEVGNRSQECGQLIMDKNINCNRFKTINN